MSLYVGSLKRTTMFCLSDGTPRIHRTMNMTDTTVSTVYLHAFNHSTTVAAVMPAKVLGKVLTISSSALLMAPG
jgi:hypothetical protein